MKSRNLNNKEKKPDSWYKYNDTLAINKALMGMGILFTQTIRPAPNNPPTVTSDSFPIKNRTFVIIPNPLAEQNATLEKNKKFALNLDAAKTAFKLIETLYAYAGTANHQNSHIIINSSRKATRKDEFFLPFILDNENKVGFYICPSQKDGSNIENFKGFDVFATAGCMGGSGIQGMDQQEGTFSLIKHNIKNRLFLNQKITNIYLDEKEGNPYEETIFSELEKLALFIDKYSTPNKPKELLYHLPYYDYILFGVELFISGRITLCALGDFFDVIHKKYELHKEKITTICNKHNITVRIESPFENLFGPIHAIFDTANCIDENNNNTTQSYLTSSDENNNNLSSSLDYNQFDEISSDKDNILASGEYINSAEDNYIDPNNEKTVKFKNIAKTILNALNLPYDEIDPNQLDEETQKENEKKLVQYCLRKLQDNYTKPDHRQVWKDFMAFTDCDKINTLDDLFKLANAIMVAIISRNNKKVCSWLPLSEKPIQISYSDYIKKFQDPVFELLQKIADQKKLPAKIIQIKQLINDLNNLELLLEEPLLHEKISTSPQLKKELLKELAPLKILKNPEVQQKFLIDTQFQQDKIKNLTVLIEKLEKELKPLLTSLPNDAIQKKSLLTRINAIVKIPEALNLLRKHISNTSELKKLLENDKKILTDPVILEKFLIAYNSLMPLLESLSKQQELLFNSEFLNEFTNTLVNSEKFLSEKFLSVMANLYPSVFNITVMEPIITYGPQNNGQLFYSGGAARNDLTKLIKEEKILEHVHKNIGLFATNGKTTPISEILDNKPSLGTFPVSKNTM